MKIHISGKSLDTGDAVKAHVEKHLVHVVDKYFENALDAHITLGKQNHSFTVLIAIHIGHDIYVRGSAEADQPYPAIDQAIHVIEKNLRRYKKRLREHHTRGAREQSTAKQYILSNEYLNLEGHEETETHAHPTIVAETTQNLPILSVSEAVMRMDLAGESLFLFKNSASGEINVIHTRPDGNIGWIEPIEA